MGFSIRDKFNEATAQLNVFDGGKSAVTVRNNRQVQAAQTLRKKQDDEATMNMLRQKANQRLEQQARTGTIPVSRVPGFGVRKPQINQAMAYNQNKANLMFDGDKTQMPKALPDVNLNQGVMAGFRNVIDSNSPVDQINRAREGRAVSYRQSELDRGNMRPMENIGQQFVGNTARLVNTASQAINASTRIGDIQTATKFAEKTGDSRLLESVLQKQEGLNKQLSTGEGGLLNAGNFLYNNEADLSMSTGEALKRSGLNTLGTASEVLPFKINPMRTAGLTTRLVANAGVDTVLGAGESSARQYLQTGKVDPKTVAVDSVANALMGTVPTIGGAGVNKLRDPVVQTKLVNNAGKANLTRTVAKQDPQIKQIEKRIDGGVAMLPTLKGAEKASKKQEVLELIRLRNQRTKELSGTGAVGKDVRPENLDALEGKSTKLSVTDPEASIWSMQNKPLTKADEGTFAMPKELKVKQPNTESNIPVRKVTQEGDLVVKTNVNPNVKATEKRFSVDESGELIEDKKGATSIFTDSEGKVKGFRVGTEYFDAKELGDLSQVNEYGSTLATMRRNVERAFGGETGTKVNKFLVDHQQGQATKMITRMQELNTGLKSVADDLGINFKTRTGKAKKISADIQNFGEKKITKAELVNKYGKEYAEKIVKADSWFRSQYDSMLNEMNDTLTKFGYDPVPKRANYYTHFQDESLWKKFGLKMNEIRNFANPTMQDATPTAVRGKISNQLAGQSEFLKPNKRFNPFALQRKGDQATADAFQAFERYMNPTLNNIYMTPSIARARVLSRAVAQDADIMGKDANAIITQTREWANRLAGKSNRFDRPIIDTKTGNKVIRGMQWAQKKAGQNSIVGNLSTAVMQPIVLSQTAGKFGFKNTLLGLMQEMSRVGDDGAIRKSSFLKRRYANLDRVTAGKMDAARNVANKPLEIFEETTARSTWRAAYNDALSQGKKGDSAIQYADIQAEKTLSGRSIGEKPELFESKSAGLLTMYQLEVNNYWQQVGKEMTKGQVAKSLVAAYGINLLLQEVTGRQVGFNPIDAAIDSYQETQKEDKSVGDKIKTIGQRFAGEVVDNTPFIAPIANFAVGDKSLKNFVGGDSNVGRFGVNSPVSTLVNNPEDLILPFGGSQLRKTWNGLDTFFKGGLDDKNKETVVDVPQTKENLVKGALFGNNAIPEVNQYYENLGKKKVDQKPVQNQIDSIAGTQSMQGLTKEQQRANPDEATRKEFVNINKVDRQVDKEKEEIKTKDSENVKQLSNGKVYAKVNDEWKTFDSQSDYDKSVKKQEKQKIVDEFLNGDEKMKEIDGKIYMKSDDTESGYTTKSKAEFEFDKSIKGVDVELDKAKASKDYKTWLANADKKYNALIAKRDSYDPDTEFDKIDTVNKQILNLEQEYEKYDGYGGQFTKGKKGSKTSKNGLDLGKLFAYGNPASSTNKSLRSLLDSLV